MNEFRFETIDSILRVMLGNANLYGAVPTCWHFNADDFWEKFEPKLRNTTAAPQACSLAVAKQNTMPYYGWYGLPVFHMPLRDAVALRVNTPLPGFMIPE